MADTLVDVIFINDQPYAVTMDDAARVEIEATFGDQAPAIIAAAVEALECEERLRRER